MKRELTARAAKILALKLAADAVQGLAKDAFPEEVSTLPHPKDRVLLNSALTDIRVRLQERAQIMEFKDIDRKAADGNN